MKQSNKLDKPVNAIAQTFADRFIATYGIIHAEQVARLVLEKIRANKNSIERKYGEK